MSYPLKRFALWASSLALLGLQTSCMTPAEQLDDLTITTKLRKGQTQLEVRRLFGAPKVSQTGSDGKRLDIYRVDLPTSTGQTASIQVRSLHVLYSPEGRVLDFSHYVGHARTVWRVNNRWEAGQWLGPNDIQKIERNVTTRDALIQWFGPATLEGLNVHGDKVMSWVFVEGQRGRAIRGRELAVLVDGRSITRDYTLRDVQP